MNLQNLERAKNVHKSFRFSGIGEKLSIFEKISREDGAGCHWSPIKSGGGPPCHIVSYELSLACPKGSQHSVSHVGMGHHMSAWDSIGQEDAAGSPGESGQDQQFLGLCAGARLDFAHLSRSKTGRFVLLQRSLGTGGSRATAKFPPGIGSPLEGGYHVFTTSSGGGR
jgi:hypothetical protein